MSKADVNSGDFLIADPFLKDNSFTRSVVLLCESDPDGTLGFILNKKLPHLLGDLLTEMEGYEFPIMYGGPVRTDTLHFVHSIPEKIPGGLPIAKDIYWGGNFQIMLDNIRNNNANTQNLRLFLGQSGWAEKQLQSEIQEHTWLSTAANKDIVFHTFTDEIWKDAVKLMGKKYAEVVNYLIDPSLN